MKIVQAFADGNGNVYGLGEDGVLRRLETKHEDCPRSLATGDYLDRPTQPFACWTDMVAMPNVLVGVTGATTGAKSFVANGAVVRDDTSTFGKLSACLDATIEGLLALGGR